MPGLSVFRLLGREVTWPAWARPGGDSGLPGGLRGKASAAWLGVRFEPSVFGEAPTFATAVPVGNRKALGPRTWRTMGSGWEFQGTARDGPGSGRS